MNYKNFEALVDSIRQNQVKKRVVLAAAQDMHALEAVRYADQKGIAEPILVGERASIQEMLCMIGASEAAYRIVEAKTDAEAAQIAVDLIRDGVGDFLMKGKLQTADLLRAVVQKENGLSQGRPMSHLALFEIPNYHKLLGITDGGMMLYPDLEGKVHILENAVSFYHKMGYTSPKVAVLAAVETVNPKMQETVDAHALKMKNIEKEICGCLIEGPISYDLALSRESAAVKGYESPVSGDPDILLVPNITAGNLIGKTLIYSANAKMAGIVIGAKVPIVLTSRGATMEEKYLSLALAAAVCEGAR